MTKRIDIVHIKELIEDGGKIALALVDKTEMFTWYFPENVTGLNKRKLQKINSSMDDSNMEADDQLLIEYMDECIEQRYSGNYELDDKDRVEPITYIQSLLYMVEEFGSELNYSSINRCIFSYDDLEKILTLIEESILNIDSVKTKKQFLNFCYYFYCHKYISPELNYYPSIQKFLGESKNILRLDKLEKIR